MTSTSVKYFHSAMTGAPELSGTAGALIAVLDACLVNGFNVKTVDTLTVASGVATATIGLGIGAFEADTVALVSGATPSGLNGQKRILTVDTVTNTVTFDATGISDQTATGTISIKLAPAGWAKSFTGTNKGVYRSTELSSAQLYYRLNDTGDVNARVIGYESMSTVDTGTGPFPSSAQVSGGVYWAKSTSADATAKPWVVIADGATAYVYLGASGANFGLCYMFGDIFSYKVGDAYRGVVAGGTSAPGGGYGGDLSQNGGDLCVAIARAHTNIGSSVLLNRQVESYSYAAHSGAANATAVPVYPNGADAALVMSRLITYETGSLRGVFPGLGYCVQNVLTSFAHRDKIPGAGGYEGRNLVAIKCGADAIGGAFAVLFFDITGPWA